MIYVFDTSSINILKDYYPKSHRAFWRNFTAMIEAGNIISVREVYKELDGKVDRPHIQEWIQNNRNIFLPLSSEETLFVREIFSVSHFKYLLKPRSVLTSRPIADPFVIAAAKLRQGCVITEEEKKDNAAKIPNVCEHFGVECDNLEGFLQRQGWEF